MKKLHVYEGYVAGNRKFILEARESMETVASDVAAEYNGVIKNHVKNMAEIEIVDTKGVYRILKVVRLGDEERKHYLKSKYGAEEYKLIA